jgi:hypothetical protein
MTNAEIPQIYAEIDAQITINRTANHNFACISSRLRNLKPPFSLVVLQLSVEIRYLWEIERIGTSLCRERSDYRPHSLWA